MEFVYDPGLGQGFNVQGYKMIERNHMPSHVRYKLTDGVQVREEKFGLLFYNYRGPRLYFVPSKDLIEVDFFNGHQSVSGLVTSLCARKGWTTSHIGKKIMQILAKLEDKGLIHGQPIR